MARLTRQQLKKDEFATGFEAVRHALVQNQRQIIRTSIAVLVVGGIVLGTVLYVSSRQSKASSAFALAMAAFHAPVTATLPPNSKALSFKTDAEKYQQALQQFTDVADRYSRYTQGKFARYYAALCERELGKFPEAEKDLNSVAASRDQDVAAVAKMALAGLYIQTNRNDQAEKMYRDLEQHPAASVPKATVELALADLYQKTKPAEAAAMYKKIQTEYPGLAAGGLASKMLQTGPQ